MPLRHKGQVDPGVFVQNGCLAQRLPGPALIAGLQLHNAVRQGIHSQKHPVDVLVRRDVQANVSAHSFKGHLLFQIRLCRVGVPVGLPFRFGGPQVYAVPLVELPPRGAHCPAGSILFRRRVLLVPEPPFGVVDQQPGLVPARHPQMQVIPGVQHTAHRPAHVHQPGVVQSAADLHRQAAVPGHHAVGGKVVQHLCQHTHALAGLLGHAPALHAHQLIVCRAAAVELVQAVLLEEQHIAHAGGRTGKGAVTAHVHGVAVRSNAPVAVPVGGVAQLAAVDHVLLAVAAPYPVCVLGHIFQPGHPPPGGNGGAARCGALAAVHALPGGTTRRHGKAAVIACALGLWAAGQHNAVPVHLLNGHLTVHALGQIFFHQPGHLLHRNGIPLLEARSGQPGQGHLHAVQKDLRPLAALGIVLFQHVHIGPLAGRGVLFQKQRPVRRAGRFRGAHAAHGVGLAARVAGGNGHRAGLAPCSAQGFQLSGGRVKALGIRPDQDLRAHADHNFLAVRHGVFQHDLPARSRSGHVVLAVLGVAQGGTLAQQQAVQVVHPVAAAHGPHGAPGCPGLQCGVSPAGKVLHLGKFCLGAGIAFVQAAKGRLDALPRRDAV